MITQSTIEPVRRVVTVKRTPEEAFRLFTEEIGTWWPVQAHSAGEPKPEAVMLEPRDGGLIYERLAGGEIAAWGHVLAWEPPHRLVLEWQPNPNAAAATEVEVRFTAEANGTRVELEHRGWERLGERAALARMEYDLGWDGVLGRFAVAGNENGPAITALVLGIVSLVVPFLGFLTAPFGVGFGLVGIRRGRRGARHGALATAGLTLSVVGLALWLVLLLLVFASSSWSGHTPRSGHTPSVRITPPQTTPQP
ncbi:MAG: SRPBCC family protein [Gaiellaceae bacterium]